jgi:hypothetical protein
MRLTGRLLVLGSLIPLIQAPACGQLETPASLAAARDERRVTSEFEVTATIAKTDYAVLEPIRIAVAARNVSGHPVEVPPIGYQPQAAYRAFRVLVFDVDGKLAAKTRFHTYDMRVKGFEVGGHLIGYLLEDGHQSFGTVVANLMYDLTSPGEYTILIEFPCGERVDVGGQTIRRVAQSAELKVRVIEEPPSLPDFSKPEPAP